MARFRHAPTCAAPDCASRTGHAARGTILAVAIVIVAVVAFNTAAAFLLRSLRLDLTESRLYTLSPGVVKIVDSLDEPVRLDLYWSAQAGEQTPQIRSYAQRVRETLEELTVMSGGKLSLSIIDPEPFSEAEDAARAAGLAKISVDGAGTTLTLGLVVRSSTDQQEVLPYLAPQDESFLEYEVARAILAVGRETKPKLALVSSLTTESTFNPQVQREPMPAPLIFEQLRQLADVETVPLTADALPADAQALVLVHPRALSESMLKAIDAFALSGKPIILFFDPWCETDPSAQDPGFGGSRPGTSSELDPLPAAWGWNISTDVVVGDLSYATRVRAPAPGGGVRELDYPVWLSLTKGALVAEDPMTNGLNGINLMSAGAVEPVEGASTTIERAIHSSKDSQLIQTLKLGYFGDPEQLIKDFKSDDTERVLAARVTGAITTAFPPADGGSPRTGSLNLFVIADADCLADRTWVTEERMGNVSLGWRSIADNGPLAYNAIEIMTGTEALSGLRGRGEYRRPFERVNAIQRAAEAQFVTREKELQEEIRKAEMRIAQLQRERTDQSSVILTPEQEAELAKAQSEVLQARKELRQVQFDLRRDVADLGTRLMVANVVLWPLFVAAAAAWWMMLRSRRNGS
ncbi:MAG: Gldg family protein [Planctomycetota bacterium]|nr:Gldg family protein [Planctomycetota bacterium]MDA1106121.1 Gldg family protein [Planctomycetota bacterium]